MTENKRFAVTQTVLGSGIYDYQAEDTLCESYDEDAYGEVVDLLNELSEENQHLLKHLDMVRKQWYKSINKNNELQQENNELKEEIQLLKDGMKAYENAIPCVCTCEQVRDINSEMFDFSMKQNKFYKEHPNRCTVVVDGVRYD